MSGRAQRLALLPPSLAPIGIGREEAAAFLGISPSLFERLVTGGIMPEPRMLLGRLIWDVEELTKAFRRAPHRAESVDAASGSANPWD